MYDYIAEYSISEVNLFFSIFRGVGITEKKIDNTAITMHVEVVY